MQVDNLERDALEVLGLVRSLQNNFAPINKIPSEVFHLIPGHLKNDDRVVGEGLITMTHVCRGWRELLIARSSLWAHLDCKNTDKTRVYIERSKSSPLKLSLCCFDPEDAFLLVVPHLGRLESLSLMVSTDFLKTITPHFSRPIPLLRELSINIIGPSTAILEDTLFNGDLSSLRSLVLDTAITHLPWKNLSKLTMFSFIRVPDEISMTQLLDFFEGAPHLRDILLNHLVPTSDAPPGRVVSLPCLKNLTINDGAGYSVLSHLCIPAGASLSVDFLFDGDKSPLPDLLPKTLGNLKNISSITSVNLYLFATQKRVRLDGPSGGLCMLCYWEDLDIRKLRILDNRIIRSLDQFILSGVQKLTITIYERPYADDTDKSTPYDILLLMEDLRTLTLIKCDNLPFILALNPDQNHSKCVPCPKLKELVLYVVELGSFNIKELKSMAEGRASAGVKLWSITIVSLGELMPGETVFGLKEYVTHVNYRVEQKPPRWDGVPEDEDN